MMNNMVFVPLRGKPSQSRLTPCQLPRKGELFLLAESTAFDGKHRLAHFPA